MDYAADGEMWCRDLG